MITLVYAEKMLTDKGVFDTQTDYAAGVIEFRASNSMAPLGSVAGFSQKGEAECVSIAFCCRSAAKRIAAEPPMGTAVRGEGAEFVIRDEESFGEFAAAAHAAVQAAREAGELDADSGEPGDEAFDPSLEETEAEGLEKQRRGQPIYRKRIDELWGSRCAVTGISTREVLRASHAIAWKDCKTGADRLSPYNGLLLCANLDALFDRHLIAFDEDGRMLVSRRLSGEERRLLGVDGERSVALEPQHQRFMAAHRAAFLREEASAQEADSQAR